MGIRDSKYDREQTRDNNTSMKKIIWPIYGRERRGQVVNRKPLKNNDNADEWKGLIQVKNEHSGAVNSLTTIKPSYCISGGKDHQIIVQNVDTGEITHKWNEHSKEVSKVRSQMHLTASASRDLSIKIWNLEEKNSLCTLQGHTLVVNGIDFNFAETMLCSGSRDNTVRIWDIERKFCISEEKVSRNLVTDIKWLKNDHIIAQTGEDKMLKLWDARTLQVVHTFPPQNQIQTCCDVSGIYCITGNNGFARRGCEISLWDLRKKAKLEEFRGHSETVSGCKFVHSPVSPRFIASCSHDGSVCVWQESQNTPLCQEYLGVGTLTCLAELNHDTLVCGSYENGIRLIRRALSGKLVPV